MVEAAAENLGRVDAGGEGCYAVRSSDTRGAVGRSASVQFAASEFEGRNGVAGLRSRRREAR